MSQETVLRVDRVGRATVARVSGRATVARVSELVHSGAGRPGVSGTVSVGQGGLRNYEENTEEGNQEMPK